MQPRPLEQLPQRRTNPLQPLALGQFAHRRARHQDDILAVAQLALDPVKRFAQKALYKVALDRASDLTGDRQPQAGTLARRVGEAVEHQVTVRRGASMTVNPLELCTSGETSPVGSAAGRSRRHLVTPTGACGPCCGGA